MRRVELLIEDARRDSHNREYSNTVGIPQESFVSFINEAQDLIFAEAVKTHPTYFLDDDDQTVTASEDTYSLPETCYMGKVELAQYSETGQVRDLYKLRHISVQEKMEHDPGSPSTYLRQNQEIILQPPPSNAGLLRLKHVRKRPRLEIRRAKIQTKTSSVSNGITTVTALTLYTAGTSSLSTLDPGDEWNKQNYMTIVDRDGNVLMRGLEYDSINTSTGVVTITGGTFSGRSGETIAVDAYCILGSDSTNVALLPNECERYLKEWMTYKALDRDSNEEADKKKAVCDAMLASIVGSFADISGEPTNVPVTNTDMLDGIDYF